MRIVKRISATAAILLATTVLANAADIIPEPIPAPEVIPEAAATGWYLRGDIGYADFDAGDVTYSTFSGCGTPCAPGTESSKRFSKADLDDTWLLQGGIGYQVNDYFRVDATYTYFDDVDFEGRSSSTAKFNCGLLSPDNGALDSTGCGSSDNTSLSAQTLMANAYFDLGNFNGFTPYVGAGIGGAKVEWDDLDNDITCNTASGGDCLNGTGANYGTIHDRKHKGADDWRFAWAIHAGASADLTCNTKLDAGYTFTHIEGGDMFDWNSDAGLIGNQGETDDIKIHSGTIGLRYQLGGCQDSYIPQEVPVYK